MNALNDTMMEVIIAQQEKGGPLGPEFGKASPVGLFVIVLLLVMVLYIAYALTRRMRRMNRRRAFAEAAGLDPFDQQGIDQAMKEAGIADVDRARWF